MEKKVEEQYLFDFYGELLTDKQKQILEYYYYEDFSLAEIAEVMSVTRQGIFDVIKRTKSMMETYEKKLGLVRRFLKSQKIINEIQAEIRELTGLEKFSDHQDQFLRMIDQLNRINEES
ncbi:putative DNA-binding protein [Eubacteriaceae bacterium ES3]|nr:putative DNA-binding protein [Eubacteriaceae bacterium ES3]